MKEVWDLCHVTVLVQIALLSEDMTPVYIIIDKVQNWHLLLSEAIKMEEESTDQS